jgi:carbonic anhydrase
MTRSLIALTSICMLAACGANAPTPQTTAVGDPVPALDAEAQAALTADGVVSALKEGNARFLAGQSLNRDLGAQVKATATGQYPSAVVLSCIDSRIPTEIVLDQGVGDIFNARVAGNFVDDALLGSMEFATKVAGAKVVVVMGHTSCGAVKGACDNVQLGTSRRWSAPSSPRSTPSPAAASAPRRTPSWSTRSATTTSSARSRRSGPVRR